MNKKILVLSASPKRNGNTAALVRWFVEGARSKGAKVEVVNTAFLKYKSTGCNSCRACQKLTEYECVVNDEAKPVLAKMAKVDVIVMGSRKVSMRATRWGGKIFRLLLSTDNNDAGTLYAVWTKQTSSRHFATKREGYDRTLLPLI